MSGHAHRLVAQKDEEFWGAHKKVVQALQCIRACSRDTGGGIIFKRVNLTKTMPKRVPRQSGRVSLTKAMPRTAPRQSGGVPLTKAKSRRAPHQIGGVLLTKAKPPGGPAPNHLEFEVAGTLEGFRAKLLGALGHPKNTLRLPRRTPWASKEHRV